MEASQEPALYEDYVDFVQRLLAQESGRELRTIDRADLMRRLSAQRGAGPLALMVEGLDERDLTRWTSKLIRNLRQQDILVQLQGKSIGQMNEIRLPSFEWWAIREHGQVLTTLGPRSPLEVVGAALRAYGWGLPLADPEISMVLNPPRTLTDVPDRMLVDFLGRGAYPTADPADLVELIAECARRDGLRRPERIPAVSGRGVELVATRNVVLATGNPDEMSAIRDAGWSWLPYGPGAECLVDRWGILRAPDALARSVEAFGVERDDLATDQFPTLGDHVNVSVARLRIARAQSIFRVFKTPEGERRSLQSHALRDDGVVLVDRELDDIDVLEAVNAEKSFGLNRHELQQILEADEQLRRSEVIERARSATSDAQRLLCLVSVDVLREGLPHGLLDAIEAETRALTAVEIADVFLRIHGNDAVREIRSQLRGAGIPVPDSWDGSPRAQKLVKGLGFSTAFAGVREVRPPNVTQVQGKIELGELHDYQQDLARQITDLVQGRQPNGDRQRALLYLPTGAGKTRVTVEAILTMMRDGALGAPVLWIAQTQELCEQAIHAFGQVWRWLGDARPLDVSRFWGGYELDESQEELQVVVAIDATLRSRLHEREYEWLTQASLVVVDEAHTAGNSPTYTKILGDLGLTSNTTTRPLLGLTATPFKGRNDEINRLFAARFGDTWLTALDEDDPIGELRRRQVLSDVDYDVLQGSAFESDAQAIQMHEVSRTMLEEVGKDMQRTTVVVNDIAGRIRAADGPFPVLVFAASVASAHTIAALLELRDIRAAAVDGTMRAQERRRVIQQFKDGEINVLVNCDVLTQGFDAPKVRALYVARPTFSPNRYLQMVGRGLRGPKNGGTERCLIVNVADTFDQFGEELAYNEFNYLWSKA